MHCKITMQVWKDMQFQVLQNFRSSSAVSSHAMHCISFRFVSRFISFTMLCVQPRTSCHLHIHTLSVQITIQTPALIRRLWQPKHGNDGGEKNVSKLLSLFIQSLCKYSRYTTRNVWLISSRNDTSMCIVWSRNVI